jgi:spermidine/putrescine transport system permease protein
MKARTGTWLLMLPGLLWLGLLMVVPCLLIFVLIFFERGVYGGVDWQAPTLENVTRVFDPLYLSIFWDSAVIAGLSTLVALLIGYPAAYAIAKAPASRQTALLFLAILPFWTNYLIRTYAWIVLLNPAGLINTLLIWAGLRSEPLTLLYTKPAVVLGLVYSYTPFVILAIYSALQRLDPSYAEASRDLGAGAFQTFLRIILPLTAPGLAAASSRWSEISSTTSSSRRATGPLVPPSRRC